MVPYQTICLALVTLLNRRLAVPDVPYGMFHTTVTVFSEIALYGLLTASSNCYSSIRSSKKAKNGFVCYRSPIRQLSKFTIIYRESRHSQ